MKISAVSFVAVGVVVIGASAYGLYILTRATLYVPGDNMYAPPVVSSVLSNATTSVATTASTTVATSSTPIVKNVSGAPDTNAGTSDYPVTLYIPSLGINAKVQQVGLNSIGNIGAPNNFTDVAWYKYGPAPGQPGSAIIDGHVDNGLGLAGVFKNLSTIATGTEMSVTTALGKTLVFQVVAINVYGYQNVPMASILNSSSPTIQLITCDGTWVGDQKTYDERLVVSATLI